MCPYHNFSGTYTFYKITAILKRYNEDEKWLSGYLNSSDPSSSPVFFIFSV